MRWISQHRVVLGALFATLGSLAPMILNNTTYVTLASLFCLAIVIYLAFDWLRRFKLTLSTLASGYKYSDSAGEFWIKTAFIACITALLVTVFVHVKSFTQKREPPKAVLYFNRWSTEEVGVFSAEVNSRTLVEFKDEYRIMVACQLPDLTIDWLDDTRLIKSSLYEIQDGDIGIRLPLTLKFLEPLKNSHGHMLQCLLCLVPRSQTPNEIQSLRHLKDRGGWILQPAGVSIASLDSK